MSDLPEPMTPVECDLQGLPFMPLHVARLRDSDLAAEESAEACWYAVVLWCASWHQLPAASLPDNDAVLAKLAGLGRDHRTWARVKAGALRGFVKCSDGRFYHPVVAEQAMEAWGRREEFEEARGNKESRQQRWRRRCKELGETLRGAGVTPPAGASLRVLEDLVARLPRVDVADARASTGDVSVDGPEMPLTGTGTGTGTVRTDPDGSGAEAPSDVDFLADLRKLDAKAGAWRLALKVLMSRGGYTEARARPLVGKWSKGSTSEQLWRACEAAWDAGTLDPVSYVTSTLERIVSEDADPMLHPEEWRQRKWVEEFREGQFAWNGQRGPEPGQPGCRISPEILREFGIEPAAPQPVRKSA